MKAYYIG